MDKSRDIITYLELCEYQGTCFEVIMIRPECSFDLRMYIKIGVKFVEDIDKAQNRYELYHKIINTEDGYISLEDVIRKTVLSWHEKIRKMGDNFMDELKERKEI